MGSDFDSFDQSPLGDFLQSPLGDRNNATETGRMVLAQTGLGSQAYPGTSASQYASDVARYRTAAEQRGDPVDALLRTTVMRHVSTPQQLYAPPGAVIPTDLFHFTTFADLAGHLTVNEWRAAFQANASGMGERRWTILISRNTLDSFLGTEFFQWWEQDDMAAKGNSYISTYALYSNPDFAWIGAHAGAVERSFSILG